MPPANARQVRPHPSESRQHVAQLGELNLQLGFVRSGPRRKDVEDDLGAVHHPSVDPLLDPLPLRRREFLVEDHQGGFRLEHELGQFLDLALADQRGGARRGHLLRKVPTTSAPAVSTSRASSSRCSSIFWPRRVTPCVGQPRG